ncbi:MAG: hypothetical protein AAF495_03600 [Pseudomonadota bacterium]
MAYDAVPTPKHPNKYSSYIDQLFAQAKELENRLAPVLNHVDEKDAPLQEQPQLLSDLDKVTRRFEEIINRIAM